MTMAVSPVGAASGAASLKDTVTLSGDAVGSVHFGEAQNVAAAALVRLIGKSEGGVRKASEGECTISAGLYWSDFAAYFYHGKFDGYQAATNKSGRAFNGSTPQGLRVGDTLAHAKSLYGSALTTSGEQGGVYAAITATGTIRGYLSTEPSQASATKVKVLTIDAGSVGCPAMSPG